MKKRLLLLSLILGIATVSHAQWSAGALVGLGHLSQRQESLSPDRFLSISGAEPIQALKMAGGYGQFATSGKWPLLAGLQLRYQYQQQTHGNYDYLVAMPYVGVRLFKNLEVAAGPEFSALLRSGIIAFYHARPTKLVIGYNVKATYWLGNAGLSTRKSASETPAENAGTTYWLSRFGLEAGYSHQNTAFNREEYPTTATFVFYNRYVYGALKYRFTR